MTNPTKDESLKQNNKYTLDDYKYYVEPYINFLTPDFMPYMNSTSESINKALSSSWDFVVARIPNIKEAVTSSMSKSVVETISGDLNARFGNNPTAKAIIRDSSKLSGVVISSYHKHEIGGTGKTYDEGNIVSAIVKVSCKASILIGHGLTSKNPDYEIAGRKANYICEPLSRFFVVVSGDRQIEGSTDQNYFSYMVSNFKLSWVFRSLFEGIAKTSVTDQLGEILKPAIKQATTTVNVNTNTLDKKIASVFTQNLELINSFESGESIYHRASKVTSIDNYVSRYALTAFSAVTNVLSKFVVDLGVTYVMSVPARIGQDLTGEFIDFFFRKFENLSEIFNKTDSSAINNLPENTDNQYVGDLAKDDL